MNLFLVAWLRKRVEILFDFEDSVTFFDKNGDDGEKIVEDFIERRLADKDGVFEESIIFTEDTKEEEKEDEEEANADGESHFYLLILLFICIN